MKLTLILMVINNYTPFPTFGKMDVNFLFSCVKKLHRISNITSIECKLSTKMSKITTRNF
jgi:hypothetical protein